MHAPLQAMMLIALLGATLRWWGLLGQTHAERIVQAIFRISLPATILISVDRLPFDPTLWRLPVAAWLVMLSLLPCSWLLGRTLHLSRASRGTVLIGTSIMNMAFFGYGVLFGLFGQTGLARAILFDLGRGLLVFTVVFAIAVAHGLHAGSRSRAFGRFLMSPPLWAICGVSLFRAAGFHLPQWLHTFLTPVHLTTMPLASLVLGLSMDASGLARHGVVAAAAVLLRMGGGGIAGWIWATALGLSDVDRAVVALSGAMPVGLNTLVFATEEDLDQSLAATMVTLSIGAGLICLPAMPWLVSLLRS